MEGAGGRSCFGPYWNVGTTRPGSWFGRFEQRTRPVRRFGTVAGVRQGSGHEEVPMQIRRPINELETEPSGASSLGVFGTGISWPNGLRHDWGSIVNHLPALHPNQAAFADIRRHREFYVDKTPWLRKLLATTGGAKIPGVPPALAPQPPVSGASPSLRKKFADQHPGNLVPGPAAQSPCQPRRRDRGLGRTAGRLDQPRVAVGRPLMLKTGTASTAGIP